MNCDVYRKYELGEIDQAQFEMHAQDCPTCRQHLKEDALLLGLARTLKQPIEAPLLWGKIEDTLRGEQDRISRKRFFPWHLAKPTLLKIAAVLLLGIGITLYFSLRPEERGQRLLTASALRQVEEKEQAYIEAIAELERTALPKMPRLNADLASFYREKLAVIDEQIATCREAIKENPANAHVRRYLLAALQDKKQTLLELAKFEPSVQ